MIWSRTNCGFDCFSPPRNSDRRAGDSAMSPGRGFDPAALASEPPQMTEALRRLEAICPQFRQSDQACACRPDGGGLPSQIERAAC